MARTTFVAAGSRLAAECAARELGLQPNRWQYLKHELDLRGYDKGLPVIVEESFREHARYADIWELIHERNMQVLPYRLP